MKKLFIFLFTLTVILYFGSMPLLAQSKSQGHGPTVEHGKSSHDDTKHEATEDKFEERIERDPTLRANVESMLPRGINLKTAASGFKNEGQFIAALHVSKNLDIPFNQLKAKMTGPNAMSHGEAIHALRPNTPEKQAHQEAKLAEKQAKETEKAKTKRIT